MTRARAMVDAILGKYSTTGGASLRLPGDGLAFDLLEQHRGDQAKNADRDNADKHGAKSY